MSETESTANLFGLAGEDAAEISAFTESLQHRHAAAIRPRASLRPGDLPFALTQVPWYPQGYWVAMDEKPSRSLHHVVGDYYIQDAGSMLAMAACKIEPGMRVCDLCAAPGGKSTAIADRLGDRGWLLANEPIASRASVLEFNLARTGSVRWAVSTLDPDRLAGKLAGEFDLVLVDAPCSGQTLVARGKQRDAAWSPRQIEHSAARQRRILEAAVHLLRPGGQLVYSTCTFAVAENEAQVDWLVSDQAMFPEPIAALAPYEVTSHPACYRLWPHRHPTAGAFAASLRKGSSEPVTSSASAYSRSPKRDTLVLPDLETWGYLENSFLHQRGQRIFAWPNDFPDRWLGAVASGPEVAYQTGKTWHPAYSLALRSDSQWTPKQVIDLDTPSAKAFLSGQALFREDLSWQVIRWNTRPIAWGKGDGRRIRPALSPAAHQLVRSLA